MNRKELVQEVFKKAKSEGLSKAGVNRLLEYFLEVIKEIQSVQILLDLHIAKVNVRDEFAHQDLAGHPWMTMGMPNEPGFGITNNRI